MVQDSKSEFEATLRPKVLQVQMRSFGGVGRRVKTRASNQWQRGERATASTPTCSQISSCCFKARHANVQRQS